MQDDPTCALRCRICGTNIKTPWGPETHADAERNLREHIERHWHSELLAYAMREHFDPRPNPRPEVES